MKSMQEIAQSLFFQNNGEIDLLTGLMAVGRLDQIIRRDIALADRNKTGLGIISVKLDLEKFLQAIGAIDENQIVDLVENELVNIGFLLKNQMRQSDCICRVSQIGFWVFITGADTHWYKNLLIKVRQQLPAHLILKLSNRLTGEGILDWYKRVDLIHFS